ncbi:hypothetical protein Tco_0128369 [Tanacetum coccineum]
MKWWKMMENLLLFKSKKIAQVVRAWIQSKNSLVKHWNDVCQVNCTDHAKLVPLGKVCTAKETLEKNTAKGTKCKLEPLISLTDDLSLLSNMAALESCPKHNMIAYLEKTEGNVEFHEVIDFLRRSYIYHALTVSPVVSTTFVEQFWTSAKSKTINNVRHITAKVAGKFVSISEASIRTDLIFDDADGIDSLPNQAIFDAIQLMGYEGDLTVLTFNKALFSPQWRKLANISVPLDHFPVNSLTSKVFSFMIKKGKHFSGKVTPLFDTMLVQPTQDEGASSERLSDEQPSPSPAPTSEVPNESLPDSSSAQPSEYSEKEGVSTDFEKVSTDRPIVSTDGSKVSTDEQVEGIEEQRECTEEIFESTEEQRPGTEEKVESTAGQIEATLLLNMSQAKATSKEKEKGVELKDVEEIDTPRPTSTRSLLTLKPLPKIDPKDKGKKKMEEEDEFLKVK